MASSRGQAAWCTETSNNTSVTPWPYSACHGLPAPTQCSSWECGRAPTSPSFLRGDFLFTLRRLLPAADTSEKPSPFSGQSSS